MPRKPKIAGIYKFMNRKNGKFYIGSSVDCHARIAEHIRLLGEGDDKCKLLQRAWTKHRKDAFEHFIVLECPPDDRIFIEEAYIQTLKPTYNCNQNPTVPEPYRRPVVRYSRQNLLIETHPSIQHAADTIESHYRHIVAAADGRVFQTKGYRFAWYGETLIDTDRRKPIFQLTLDGTYIKKWSGPQEAAGALGINQSSISSCLSGKLRKAGGFIWSRSRKKPQPVRDGKPVYQLDADGNVVAEFPTIKAAALAVNGDASAISKVCKGKMQTHRGFGWKFA